MGYLLIAFQSIYFYQELNFVTDILLLFFHKNTIELYNELAYFKYHFCEIYLYEEILLWKRRRCVM